MTKKEMFALIATVNADNEEIVAFCEKEIALLENRKSSKSPTKTQKEKMAIKETIVEVLASAGVPVTVTELLKADERLASFSNQKVSALLRQLVSEGKVVKAIEGKKAYFSAVTE